MRVLDKLPRFPHVRTTSSVTLQAVLRVLSSSKHAFSWMMNAVEPRDDSPSSGAWSVSFHKGVSHAPWPEKKHESAPKEAICWPLTAAATDYAARRATGFSQREKKL